MNEIWTGISFIWPLRCQDGARIAECNRWRCDMTIFIAVSSILSSHQLVSQWMYKRFVIRLHNILYNFLHMKGSHQPKSFGDLKHSLKPLNGTTIFLKDKHKLKMKPMLIDLEPVWMNKTLPLFATFRKLQAFLWLLKLHFKLEKALGVLYPSLQLIWGFEKFLPGGFLII